MREGVVGCGPVGDYITAACWSRRAVAGDGYPHRATWVEAPQPNEKVARKPTSRPLHVFVGTSPNFGGPLLATNSNYTGWLGSKVIFWVWPQEKKKQNPDICNKLFTNPPTKCAWCSWPKKFRHCRSNIYYKVKPLAVQCRPPDTTLFITFNYTRYGLPWPASGWLRWLKSALLLLEFQDLNERPLSNKSFTLLLRDLIKLPGGEWTRQGHCDRGFYKLQLALFVELKHAPPHLKEPLSVTPKCVNQDFWASDWMDLRLTEGQSRRREANSFSTVHQFDVERFVLPRILSTFLTQRNSKINSI